MIVSAEKSIPHNTNLDFKYILSLPRKTLIELNFHITNQISNLCPECEGKTEEHNGEKVCTQCGLVHGKVYYKSNKIPGNGSNNTYNPSLLIAWGKNLGSQIGKNEVKDYISIASGLPTFKCRLCGEYVTEENQDIHIIGSHPYLHKYQVDVCFINKTPLKAMEMYNLERAVIEPDKITRNLLRQASDLSKRYGYRDDKVFGQKIGRLTRKIASQANYWLRVYFTYYLIRIKSIPESQQQSLFDELGIKKEDLEKIMINND